jgi:hypothetical protein
LQFSGFALGMESDQNAPSGLRGGVTLLVKLIPAGCFEALHFHLPRLNQRLRRLESQSTDSHVFKILSSRFGAALSKLQRDAVLDTETNEASGGAAMQSHAALQGRPAP